MNILIKNAILVDADYQSGRKPVNIVISRGRIHSISDQLEEVDFDQVIEGSELHVSTGWVDLNVQIQEPGFEFRENLNETLNAAAAGGYTAIATQANTQPVTDNKSAIEFLINQSKHALTRLLPMASISKSASGDELAELLDLADAGAVAFYEGNVQQINAGLMLRALQYAKTMNGLIFSLPYDGSLISGGSMHEGVVSTERGIAGIPHLDELLALQRDLALLEYSQSRLHFSAISCAQSVEMIRAAKAKGLRISASVNALNLLFTEQEMPDFDTNFKVLPPLRTEQDRKALIEGLIDGTIDSINSGHCAVESEAKLREFDHASFGAINLQTAFAALHEGLADEIELADLISALSSRAGKIIGLDFTNRINEGDEANLTIFDLNQPWQFDVNTNQSPAKNSPYLGKTFKAAVVGCINSNRIRLN